MAAKDIAGGWGALPGGLAVWHCPACNADYPVEAWEQVFGEVNGHKMDGRKCPSVDTILSCEFVAYQTYETEAMRPAQ